VNLPTFFQGLDQSVFIQALQHSAFSEWIRGSLKALPIIESVHVMAVAVVYGTILLVDLRLMGLRDTGRPFTRVFRELMRWTWIGFGVAVVTGALLFIPNAQTYARNTAFFLKLSALFLAGVNMAIFEFTTLRRVASWDTAVPSPFSARVAGALSILIWTSVIVFGRWIGFTKGYDFSVPDELDLDFSQGLLHWLDTWGPLV
jgi:hypothetical protein